MFQSFTCFDLIILDSDYFIDFVIIVDSKYKFVYI